MAWRSRSAAPEDAPPVEEVILGVGRTLLRALRLERVGTALWLFVERWRGLMVRVDDSDGARDTRPGRLRRPSAATVDAMFVVSSRLALALARALELDLELELESEWAWSCASESLEAVWGRVGKAKVGSLSLSRGKGMIINQSTVSPSAAPSATLALAGAVLFQRKISSIGPACAFGAERQAARLVPGSNLWARR
jgi:hypothetical protein